MPTHNYTFKVDKMPWHSEDKPFGLTQEEWEDLQERQQELARLTDMVDGIIEFMEVFIAQPPPVYSKPDWPAIMSGGARYDTCDCGEEATVHLDKGYCQECWEIGDDEDA